MCLTTKLRRLLLMVLIACAPSCSKTKPAWKTIDMGEYFIDVPNVFNRKPAKGIDSQPGLLKGKDFSFGYDYGAFSDTLIPTTQEYIREGYWKDVAIIQYLNSKTYPDVDWAETDVLRYRPSNKSDTAFAPGCDYIAYCAYKHYQFNLPIFIPYKINNQIVKIDTIKQHYRRLIYPKKADTGIVGVYMRDEKGNIFNGHTYPALVIGARNLNARQQTLAMQIVATLRPKPQK